MAVSAGPSLLAHADRLPPATEIDGRRPGEIYPDSLNTSKHVKPTVVLADYHSVALS